MPSCIDNISNGSHISDLFLEKYKKLYNSVPYCTEKLSRLKEQMENNVLKSSVAATCYSTHSVNMSEVINAVKRLKNGKSDGRLGQMTDHLIHGSFRLFECLSLLFTCMIKQGFIPHAMQVSTLVPIPKNKKKSLNCSENYRAIALSSILGKVLDLIIMKQHNHVFRTSDYQFGFKKNHSTTMCTFSVNEVAQYYLNNGSDAYIIMLDASKAFDRIEYTKLFTLLIERGICPMILRLLLCLYTKQILCVKWGDNVSNYCHVNNGVKQGGVLSPILFSIYIDELFQRLRRSVYGCYIGDKFMGAFGYADDCLLISPTVMSMSCLLKICDDYSE